MTVDAATLNALRANAKRMENFLRASCRQGRTMTDLPFTLAFYGVLSFFAALAADVFGWLP